MSQKVVPTNLTTTEKILEKQSLSPDQGGYNLDPPAGACSSTHCYTSAMLTGILDYLPSGNPVSQVQSIKVELFVDQVAGDIYKYDYCNSYLFLWVKYNMKQQKI